MYEPSTNGGGGAVHLSPFFTVPLGLWSRKLASHFRVHAAHAGVAPAAVLIIQDRGSSHAIVPLLSHVSLTRHAAINIFFPGRPFDDCLLDG